MANVIKSIKLGSTGTATPVISTVGATFLASGSDMRVDLVKNDGSITQLAGIIPAATAGDAGLLTATEQEIGGVKKFTTPDLSKKYRLVSKNTSVTHQITPDVYDSTGEGYDYDYYIYIDTGTYTFTEIPEYYILSEDANLNIDSNSITVKNSKGEDITSFLGLDVYAYGYYADSDDILPSWPSISQPIKCVDNATSIAVNSYVYRDLYVTSDIYISKLQYFPYTISFETSFNYYELCNEYDTSLSKSGIIVPSEENSSEISVGRSGSIKFEDFSTLNSVNIRMDSGRTGCKLFIEGKNVHEEYEDDGIATNIIFSRNSIIGTTGNSNNGLDIYNCRSHTTYGYISNIYTGFIGKTGTTASIGSDSKAFNSIYSREYLNGTSRYNSPYYGYTYIYPLGQTVYYQVGITNSGITGSIGASYSSMQFGYINNIFTRALYPEDSPRNDIDEYGVFNWGDDIQFKDVGTTARPHIKVGMGAGNALAGFTNLYFYAYDDTVGTTALYVRAQYSMHPALYPYKNSYGYVGLTNYKFLAGNFVNLYANAFYESSDENLKNILKPIETDLEELSKLRKVYFEWKDTGNGITGPQLGVIAQDIKKLYPEIVDGEEGGLTVQYDKLGVIALDAVDKLYQENKELKARCESLEKRVQRLENLLM
jgi:hypothetical protein